MTPLRAGHKRGWNAVVDHAVGMPLPGLPYIHAHNVNFVHCNLNFAAMHYTRRHRPAVPLETAGLSGPKRLPAPPHDPGKLARKRCEVKRFSEKIMRKHKRAP